MNPLMGNVLGKWFGSESSWLKSLFVTTMHTKCFTVQIWDFFGRNDAKAETPVLWPPHAKS